MSRFMWIATILVGLLMLAALTAPIWGGWL
jgi:hypothetical protein